MRGVRNLSERIRSMVPSLGDEGDAKAALFKCRNCGRDVEPDAEACPNRSSTNLRPLSL